MLGLGGLLYFDYHVDSLQGLTEEEKTLIKVYPSHAYMAREDAKKAGQLTDQYWGRNATNADVTRANAFKHAVWNALMVRDIGMQYAELFAYAHEAPHLYNMNEYRPQMTNAVTTIHEGTIMDLQNNERGRMIGSHIPWFSSDNDVALTILQDMEINPDAYYVIEFGTYSQPLK